MRHTTGNAKARGFAPAEFGSNVFGLKTMRNYLSEHAYRLLTSTIVQGEPIDPAIADDIFQPFVTGKADGLGLGLGIVRDIVTEFGGVVTVVPSSSGATFRVTLQKETGDDPADR